jgi:hypothetical protein
MQKLCPENILKAGDDMYTGGGYATNNTDDNSDAAFGTGLRISVFTEASRNLIY